MGEAALVEVGGGTREKWAKHYSSAHKILLVGEGDFSFSASIARSFGSAANMVATSLDSQEMLVIKYSSSEAHLKTLKELGCVVLHDVDVHRMSGHPILMTMKFDRIVFNFPHAGHFSSAFCGEGDWALIELHRSLLRGFFQSGSQMLSEGGEVHVAHRDDSPYDRWNLEELAYNAGLVLKECVEFRQEDYPGYQNKRGGSIRSDQTFPLKECFTFKFILKSSSNSENSEKGPTSV